MVELVTGAVGAEREREQEVTIARLLNEIAKIREEREHINEAFKGILLIVTEGFENVKVSTGMIDADILAHMENVQIAMLAHMERAEDSLAELVKSRELTLQKMLDVYGKIAAQTAGA